MFLHNVLQLMSSTFTEDLDAHQLEVQLWLLPQVTVSMGFDTSRFNNDDLISFFFQSINDSHVTSVWDLPTGQVIRLVMPATNASSEQSFSAFYKARKDISPFNNWRRKAEPSHEVSRPQGQKWRYWPSCWSQPVCWQTGEQKAVARDIYPKWFATKATINVRSLKVTPRQAASQLALSRVTIVGALVWL